MSNTNSPAVAVFLSDPDRVPAPPSDVLRQLYGFTEREATLAILLLKGFDLRGASENMGISLETVRTHMDHVFQKIDTRRQPELIRVLSQTGRVDDTGDLQWSATPLHVLLRRQAA